MERNRAVEKWVRFSSTVEEQQQQQQQQDEEEALSLCDLPINNEDNESRKPDPDHQAIIETQDDDFDFCSLITDQSEMCAADEVFFQGQILPLRHSVSSESGLAAALRRYSHEPSCHAPSLQHQSRRNQCISWSDSLEHCYSSGFTSGSSRSSSIRSHQSSSSGSSSSANTPISKPTRVHTQFHYPHPSPRPPQIKFANNTNKNAANCNMWSHFRLGLLTTPEIALQDLKVRSSSNNSSNKSSGSRHSSTSSKTKPNQIQSNLFPPSEITCGSRKTTRIKSDKKRKQGIFDKNGVLFGGCKCSVNAVETVPSRVVTIRRSASLNEAYSHDDEEMDQLAIKGTKQQQHAGKQAFLSRHRTFEWLKQLSLEGASSTYYDALIQKL